MAKSKAKKTDKKSCWDSFLHSGPQGRIPSITEKDQNHQTVLQRMVHVHSINHTSVALLSEQLATYTPTERDALLNTLDGKGHSPLGQALLADNLPTAEIFLSWGAKLSQALPDQQWLPAVLNCFDTEAIRAFLTTTKAAIPMAVDNINPLENNLFTSVLESHDHLLFRDMITVGIDPNRFCTAEDNLLNLALKHNVTTVISELLAHLDTDSVNAVDASGVSPLMLAAEQGNLSVVSQMLTLHGGADTTNAHGETALHRVCSLSLDHFTEEHHLIAQQLLNAMSVPDMADKQGNNPAMTAALAGNDRLCNLCLVHCNIFACNNKGQHLLFLTVYSRCLESCKTLINRARSQTNKPFCLHEKACPTPELLRKHILHNVSILSPDTDLAAPLQNLSPLSLAIVTSVLRFLPTEQNTHNMIDLLVDHHVMDTRFEDDPLFWTVITQQNHLTSLLISYGIPLSPLVLSSCPIRSKEEPNYTQPLTIHREHLIRVSCVDTLFTRGNTQKAIQEARQVHASLFRMNWAQQYWEELGDHFILLQLEYPIDHTATEKIFHTIQKNQLSPYLSLDDHAIHPLQVRLKTCLQKLLRKITHHKIQTRCNQTQQEVLLQCGFNWHNPDFYQNIPLNQQVDKTLRENLPNQLTHLHLTHEADYQSLSQQWQQYLATLQTRINTSKGKSEESDIDETDREHDINGKNIRDHFLDVLHSTVSQCFINNHHNPYAITQQLLLLHFSPCHITRLKSLIDINNIITLTKAPSWINTLGLNLLFSPPKNSLYAQHLKRIGIHLPEPQGPYYLDECEQNTLPHDQLADLVRTLVNHLIREQHATLGQEVFNSLLAALLDCPTFFTQDHPITIWLQLGAFHTRHAWFSSNTLGKVISHLQQLSSQSVSSKLIQEALSLCAPHITTELIAKLLPQPDQITWLVQRPSLISLKKSNASVFALLQALRLNPKTFDHSLANQHHQWQKQRQKRLQIANQENHQKLAQQETEIHTLTQELHKQKLAYTSLQQDHDLIREKHQRNTKELQALTTHTKVLENQLEESTRAYTQVKQALQDQEQTQKILQTQLDTAVLTHQQQEQALLSQSKQCQDLQKRLQDVEETQTSLKKENKQQQRQIKEQATAYNEAMTHADTLKKKLTETEETLQQAASTLKLVNQKNQEQKSALAQSSSELEDTQSQYVKAQEQNQQLQSRVEQLAKKETDMLTQLAKLTDINHTLTLQLAAYLPPTELNIFREPNPRELPFASTMPHLLGVLEPYCISLFWRGTSAREVLRSQHTNNDKLVEIFSVFQEDIDWTMVSTDSIATIRDELTEKGWVCDTDLKNHKLRVTATDSNLYYDIKVFAHGDTSNDYPDSIALLWDVSSKNWLFTSAQLSPTQHKFLQGLIPLNNRDTFTLCSLFWALHLGVKHIACQSPFTTVQSLIQQSILRPQKGTIPKNQAIIDILHKFTDTPYWNATLTTLLHIPFFFADANKLPSEAPKASPVIRLLLPDDAIIPPGIDWTQSPHFQTVATPSELLCALKKTWQGVETNHALLHTTAGCINWAEISSGEVAHTYKA